MTGVVLSTSPSELGPCLCRGLGAGGGLQVAWGLGMTAGWGEIGVPVDISSRRLALV